MTPLATLLAATAMLGFPFTPPGGKAAVPRELSTHDVARIEAAKARRARRAAKLAKRGGA